MRNLNAKQKTAIKKLFEKGLRLCSDLSEETYTTISNMNMHECFDSNVDRYLHDLYNEKIIKDRNNLYGVSNNY